MINQGVARAFARVRRPGVLTFAAVSEVGVSGRRVDGGHSLNSQKIFSRHGALPNYVILETLPGVISSMNPGPYRPLYLWGLQPSRREVANEPPSAKGGFASFPMVARLVRYGPVRQKKTFLILETFDGV